MDFYSEIISRIKEGMTDKDKLNRIKLELCKKYSMKHIPTDIEIMLNAEKKDIPRLKLLQTKPSRSISGVSVAAVMTKPIPCPHGKCVMCPGGVESFFGDVPQSYTGNEPATMRGMRNKYDAYLQVFNRLEQYTVLGHNFDKIELIIMGGTFPSFKKTYRESFVCDSLKAMNDFGDKFFSRSVMDIIGFKEFFELPGDIKDNVRTLNIQKKILKLKNLLQNDKHRKCELSFEQKRNENAKVRCVAMAIETRPDYCKKKHIDSMLSLGCTRVELGVQSLYDDVLDKIERGHTVSDSVKATQLMKDSFLKVGYHMMPGLPGSSPDMDIDMFTQLFFDPDFKPDALKIYPCMVMPGTKLEEMWKKGKFNPITTEQAAKLIASMKENVPEYCRIMRVQRDIPSKVIAKGVDKTNLRQYVTEEMKKNGVKCKCIRCREPRGRLSDMAEVKIKEKYYNASRGVECFISAEDEKNDVLLGFCRIRLPFSSFRKEITSRSCGVRELHVYGTAVGVGEEGEVQHRGLGKMLLARAEKISREVFDCNKILVISGIGVREYYRKLGYKHDGVYVSKRLR